MLTVTIAAALAPHSPALQIDWNIMVYRSKTGSSPSLEIHRRVAGRQSLAKKPDGELTDSSAANKLFLRAPLIITKNNDVSKI